MRERLVFDTNVLISHLLMTGSIPDQAVTRAVRFDQVLLSEATLEELVEVLSRPKFNRYFPSGIRREFVPTLLRAAEIIPIVSRISVCRDPHDDKILEVAVNGSADAIITGDADLLALDPFRGISVMTPARWLSDQELNTETC